jgi:hypothetical protein
VPASFGEQHPGDAAGVYNARSMPLRATQGVPQRQVVGVLVASGDVC